MDLHGRSGAGEGFLDIAQTLPYQYFSRCLAPVKDQKVTQISDFNFVAVSVCFLCDYVKSHLGKEQ